MKAGIVSVGRELLLGYTLDTNSHWLASELTSLGLELQRITVVDDAEGEIAQVLSQYLSWGYSLVVTTGGLGPTPDDLTLSAVAVACNRPLELHPGALAMVEETYARLHSEGKVKMAGLSNERRKMAVLPRGGEPLPNPVGAAPGCWLQVDGQVVLSLPGVPAELKGIFSSTASKRLLSLVREKGGRVVLTREVSSGIGDESVLTRLTRRVVDEVKGVYLKTLPTGFHQKADVHVRVTAFGGSEDEARNRMETAIAALERVLGEADNG